MTERCRGCPLAREGEEQQEQEILLKPADRLALRLIAPEKGCSCLFSNDVILIIIIIIIMFIYPLVTNGITCTLMRLYSMR
jgi:hypothetical protein